MELFLNFWGLILGGYFALAALHLISNRWKGHDNNVGRIVAMAGLLGFVFRFGAQSRSYIEEQGDAMMSFEVQFALFSLALMCTFVVGFIFLLFSRNRKKVTSIPSTDVEFQEQHRADTMPSNEKVCPVCAETIKAKALKCRFCGHVFLDAAAKD